MGICVQYDTSNNIVGGINIAEAVSSESKLIFNESYIVAGNMLKAPSIYACYDLTIIGNAEVDDIEVNGSLNIIGNIKAKRISCQKAIMCNGTIDAHEIIACEIIANDITSKSVSCSGNIIAKTTIDIHDSINTTESVFAGEGIIGSGQFSAKNAIAVEYFDFSGNVPNKVIELDTDTTFGQQEVKCDSKGSISDLAEKIESTIKKELTKTDIIDETELIELVKEFSLLDSNYLSDWDILLKNVIELSYLESITNLRDYLFVFMALKYLPKEIIGYETLEHVFSQLMIEAEKNINGLVFRAKDIKDFAYTLKIVVCCENDLKIDTEDILDKIFQSIGIKYKTVNSFLSK